MCFCISSSISCLLKIHVSFVAIVGSLFSLFENILNAFLFDKFGAIKTLFIALEFSETLIAIPITIVGVKLTIPILTIVVMIASLLIAIKDFKHIAKKEFFKILLLVIIGLPIDIALFKYLPQKLLKVALGDIIYGAFSCGTPFVVVYATKNIKDKFSFRARLCALWTTLNGIMLTLNIIAGEISGEIVKVSFITMLFVIVAITASNIVIKKVNGEVFTKFIYIILCISGILMIVGK